MSDKRSKKNTTKSNKNNKISKNRKIPTLRLDVITIITKIIVNMMLNIVLKE